MRAAKLSKVATSVLEHWVASAEHCLRTGRDLAGESLSKGKRNELTRQLAEIKNELVRR